MALAEAAEIQAPPPARFAVRHRTLHAFLKKKIAVVATVYIAIFYFCGFFAPLVAPYDPNEQPRPLTQDAIHAGPSGDHWLGTDGLGRDMLSRVIYASRTTVIFTLVVLITGGVFLGLGLGLLAGYRGGWLDTAIMRVGEVLSGIPTLILMLAIATAFRDRITDFAFDLSDATPLSLPDARAIVQFSILVMVTIPFAWVGTARIVRGQALAIRESAFVEAAEGMGASTWRIVIRHIFPGILPLFLVGISAGMAGIALAEVSLSWLGLGIDPPTASFGNMLQDAGGPRTFQERPHMLLSPAIPVVLFFLAWNLLGDALVDLVERRNNQAR